MTARREAEAQRNEEGMIEYRVVWKTAGKREQRSRGTTVRGAAAYIHTWNLRLRRYKRLEYSRVESREVSEWTEVAEEAKP